MAASKTRPLRAIDPEAGTVRLPAEGEVPITAGLEGRLEVLHPPAR